MFCETAACCGWIGGAKAAREAEKYANDSEDEDEENIHLADETPVMLECDEDQIIKEERKLDYNTNRRMVLVVRLSVPNRKSSRTRRRNGDRRRNKKRTIARKRRERRNTKTRKNND